MKELQRRGDPNVVIALAGNKMDLEHKRKVCVCCVLLIGHERRERVCMVIRHKCQVRYLRWQYTHTRVRANYTTLSH